MIQNLLIFEGLDGTGKTTTASKLIQLSTAELPIHYIYFPKKETTQKTYDYFYDLTYSFKYLEGVVVMDRSILSTYAYSLDTVDSLRLFELVTDYDPLIVYFDKVYDKSKLVPNYEFVKKKYERGIDFIIEVVKIPVILSDAETFIKFVNSLERLQKLLKEKRFPV